ncbi:MAG: hypothetical protein HYX67_00800 [Candidatus Melainabacteria bacterium]|nr:hypothetical protein [Candidatus Melainabacteria bacterium]
MAFQPAEQRTEKNPTSDSVKPSINAADYWAPSSDDRKCVKTAAAPPDSLTMTSPYDTPSSKIQFEPKDPSWKDILNPKDVVKPLEPLEPLDPRKEADKRDADTMMDALRKGKLEDLKAMVSDMSPEKLKRVAEQMKAEGFDITTTKDGKFVMFNKDLGIGISVQAGKDGQPATAEVVKQDKDGNYVASTDGQDPAKVLKNFATQIPKNELSDADIAKLIEEFEKGQKRDPFGLHPGRRPWHENVRPDDGMLLL